MTDAVRSPQQIRDEFQARRDTIVNEMGSSERIDRQHARGRLTIRERLDRLFDEGSFREIGTFAVSEVPNVRDRTPGDGKIGGWGEINGRAATACGDDVTVLHGSSSVVGGKRMKRIYEQALTRACRMSTSARRAGRGCRTRWVPRASARSRRRSSRRAAGAGFRWRRRSWANRSAAPRFMPRSRTSSCRWRARRWRSPARG